MSAAQIEALGRRGEGVITLGGRTLHVPFALPGEPVAEDGSALSPIPAGAANPDRIAPVCRHFMTCGGCRIQHAGPPLYEPWKRGLVERPVRASGLDATVEALVPAHGEGRRRAVLHVRFEGGRARAGFMAAGSHALVEIDTCPVLVPALAEAPALAAQIAAPLSGHGKPIDVQITATEGGLDVDLRGAGAISDTLRQTMIARAARYDLARLSLHGEVLIERRPPQVRFGQAIAVPPPGGFLQATALGETELARLVTEIAASAKSVVDLFAGCGPFALRLAGRAPVAAFDSDRAAVAALIRAARATPGLRAVQAEARDLFRRPLLRHELAAFQAIVLDPPRAGAEAQVRQIAISEGPNRIAYVSCDPGTFARDAAILVAAGWRLERVVPVDQFLYTPHVELVGAFSRDPVRRRNTRR